MTHGEMGGEAGAECSPVHPLLENTAAAQDRLMVGI